jgi:hypothetical protein
VTEEDARKFDEDGAVTIDTPLTPRQIADAAAAMDRLLPLREGNPRPSLTCSYYDPELLEILQHPFFEEAARKALRAEAVHFFQTAIVTAYPQPDTPFSFWQHVDLQYRLSDFRAVPRKVLCSFFLWLTDVDERRAPMMFRPGSHLLIAERNERDPEWAGRTPGVAPAPLETLPALPYAEPVPLLAKAGQVSVLTTAAVHGASVNVGREPRKNLVFTFLSAGTALGLPPEEEAQKREYHEGLRRRFRPERAHLIPA